MGEKLTPEQKEAYEARDLETGDALSRAGPKKVIVAGPGTGKTHFFKKLFATASEGDKLTLTFINALVEDLSLELRGISDVRTLHGYALSRFKEDRVRIFPGMHKIIRDDGRFLLNQDIDFEKKIHEIDDSEGHLDFYSVRRRYYDHFGYSDIILGLVRLFQKNPDRIPAYSQIVVDEFQDFNQLEVTLIELLSTKSPILVAGDDDQAIYDFKSARPTFIRELHGDGRPDFEFIPLSFCSRSSKVIVDTVNDLVSSATTRGFLNGRVPKAYRYFPSPDKDRESAAEPQIIHKRLEDTQIAWFIAEEINNIATERREKFDVLVISPFTAQCEKIGRGLIGKGFRAVEFKEKESHEISYLDGLRLLLRRRTGAESNLGWRIASRFKLSEEEFRETLQSSVSNSGAPFRAQVPTTTRNLIERDVEILRGVKDKQAVTPDELNTLLESLSLDQHEVKAEYVRDRLLKGRFGTQQYPGVTRIPITATTIQSSKGLSGEYVFITHFDQRYLPGPSGVSDQNICNMLVALTRAEKKVWLISTTDQSSEFLDWINPDRVRHE